MWFFLWFLLSGFVLGVFIWSYSTLTRQKKAWKAFADKNKLTYQNGPTFLSSPTVSGALGPYAFNLFSVQVPAADGRSARFNMVMEFGLHRGIPTLGAIFTPMVFNILEGHDMPPAIGIDNDPNWDPSWKIRAQNTKIVLNYLTPQRREIIAKLFRMKIISALIIFNADDMVVRLETADPLDNIERLEKITRGVMNQIEPLKAGAEEFDALSPQIKID